MFVSTNLHNKIIAVSDTPFECLGKESVKIQKERRKWDEFIGKRLYKGGVVMSLPAKPFSELRIAIVCNWNDKCGISTYSRFLADALIPKIKELRVFSETAVDQTALDEEYVDRCWTRGKSLVPAFQKLLAWNPDFIIIQHEYGIFPNACHFFKAMQMIDHIPYSVVMHSVYEHLDKAAYASAVRHIIVHSELGKQCLIDKGITGDIWVIPHGCVKFKDNSELWNIMQNPYTLFQFGFGFSYKGVERVLEAVSKLKHRDPKFANIFYCFLLSTNKHNRKAYEEYYDKLVKLAVDLDIEENVCILKKFNSEQTLHLLLRLFKLAVFPYVMQPDNTVFGASGATRVAMASGIPVVVSESHLFDDLEGVLPRPSSSDELAQCIDDLFSDPKRRIELSIRINDYINLNSWDNIADRYLATYADQFS